MERYTEFENLETKIEGLISELEERSGMNPGDITSDFVTFAPYEGNDTDNPDYFDQMAEELGVPASDLIQYALQKAREFLDLDEQSE